jgi:hypothetical protein
VLRRHEDALGEERYLFYACVSRPEEVLYLSFRSSDEEGDPATPSPFVDDVRALFGDGLWDQRGTRLLAEVTWPPAAAPTPHELQRTRAAAEREPEPPPLAPPATDAVHALLDARGPEPHGRSRRSRRAACAGSWKDCCAPIASSPTPSRCAGARSPTRSSSARSAACASARGRDG